MRSRLYEGMVRHRRLHPTSHEFSYRVFMPYICLDELPELFDRQLLWSARGWAPARFKRSDFLAENVPAAVQDPLHRRIEFRLQGKVLGFEINYRN